MTVEYAACQPYVVEVAISVLAPKTKNSKPIRFSVEVTTAGVVLPVARNNKVVLGSET